MPLFTAADLVDRPEPQNRMMPRIGTALTAQWVRESLLTHLRGRGESDSTLDVRGPIVARPGSRLFFGSGSRYGNAFAIKVCLDPTTRQLWGKAASDYYRSLLAGMEITRQNIEFRSLIPYDLVEESAIVVMEWAPYPVLSDYLNSHWGLAAGRQIMDAGAWLGRLHQGLGYTIGDLETATFLEQLVSTPEWSSEIARDSRLSRGFQVLERTAPRISSECAWTRPHHDFRLQNLMVGNTTFGFDFWIEEQAPAVRDHASFLNDMALFRRHRLLPLRIGPYAKIFLDGYERGSNGIKVARDQLLWVRLQYALRSLATVGNWATGAGKIFNRHIMARLVLRLADALGNLELGRGPEK